MEEFKVPNAVQKLPIKQTEDKVELSEDKPQEQNTPSKPLPPGASCPYKEPKWSGLPPDGIHYTFEVLKAGQIIDEVKNLHEKAFWVFGRLPCNDIEMAHPTVSRFHAILQYRPKLEGDDTEENKKQIEDGWYIYDLDSTHGTFLNKMRIPPNAYIRVKVGHMLRLGASTRSYILQGPDFDEEPESEMSITELKKMRANTEEEKKKNAAMQLEAREKEGISWGMSEDADEETDLSVNPYATTNNEELFLDDPKKTLRGYFEREGLDLEYKCDEMSVGTFVCRIELPVDDLNGRQIVAEVCHKGKKKECVVQCALEACRILDRHGVLRQANHEPLKRKVQSADSDDDDDFFDRTGDVERKKMRKSTTPSSVALTYDDLLSQEKEILGKLKDVEDKILQYQELSKRVKESKQRQDEDLDSFMENLTDESTLLDKTDIRRLRVEEKQLQADHQKIKRLIQIAKPIDLPAITTTAHFQAIAEPIKKPKQLPIIGKRNQFSFRTLKPQAVPAKAVEKELKSDEEEVEDDEQQAGCSTSKAKVAPKEVDSCKPDITPKEVNMDVTTEDELPPDEVIKEKTVTPPQVDVPSIEETPNVGKSPDKTNNEEDVQPPPIEEKPYEIKSPYKMNTEEERSAAAKKRRPRQRVRGKRENVDIDDQEEYEDTEKYSKWVPPENQSGDGITSLNDKFGY